ncbi:hypothetical protein F5B20DRAFT_518596 [Whalleya microplaca]|nr:hypothetical protein F5B20DRAFT_518596 [Whalleya microplaca]
MNNDRNATRRPYPQYFTISSVGNHRDFDNAWVVNPDGDGGHNIYRISKVLKELGVTESDYRAIVRTGPLGPELVLDDPRADAIRETLTTSNRRSVRPDIAAKPKLQCNPIGKLLATRRREEVAECNGNNGLPRWVSIGPYVYDVTNFIFVSEKEQALLMQCSGGPLLLPRPISDSQTKDLVKRLEPYLCARIQSDGENVNNHSTDRRFTPRMLRWHDNPDLGVYIALGDMVYDITSYLDFHPGGDNVMYQYAGRDASLAFANHHSLDIIQDYDYMRIGHLVPEVTLSQLQPKHLVLHSWVFDISRLSADQPDLYQSVEQYRGTDASTAISQKGDGAVALNRLYLTRKDCIVAGLAPTQIPDIPNGEVAKHNDHNSSIGAWVVAGDYVYNVGDLMRNQHCYEHEFPTGWAGKELRDPELAMWLVSNFEARRIGRVVPGPAWKTPDVGMRELRLPEPKKRLPFHT